MNGLLIAFIVLSSGLSLVLYLENRALTKRLSATTDLLSRMLTDQIMNFIKANPPDEKK